MKELNYSEIETLKEAELIYNKYDDTYVVFSSSKLIFNIRGNIEFEFPVFGYGNTIDNAELNYLENFDSLEQCKELMKFLNTLRYRKIEKFSLNIENYSNNDFHMSLVVNDQKIHTNGDNIIKTIKNLYSKYDMFK